MNSVLEMERGSIEEALSVCGPCAGPCSERGNAALEGREHRCQLRPLDLARNTDKKSSRSHAGWQFLVRGDEGTHIWEGRCLHSAGKRGQGFLKEMVLEVRPCDEQEVCRVGGGPCWYETVPPEAMALVKACGTGGFPLF